jgi:putative salt-induced outer membrane protein YdiY
MSTLPLLVSLLPYLAATPAESAAAAPRRPLDLSLSALQGEVDEEAAAAEEAPPEPTGWSGSVSLGVTLTRGNSETTTIAGSFDAERKVEENRWTVKAWYNGSSQEDPDTGESQTTAKNYGGQVQYDRFVTEKLYWLANAKGERDELAALQLRATGGLGVGYQFQDTETFDLNGEAGLNYVHEDLEGEGPNEFLAARLAYNAGYTWTETTKLGQAMELFPSLEDSDDWTGKLDTHADVSMTEAMFLRVQHVLDYDNTPAGGSNKADNRFIVTVGWSF